MDRRKKSLLPKIFRSLLWSYDFEKMTPIQDGMIIIQNTINYGTFEHWRWIKEFYGEKKIREIIATLPATSFRKPALKLASLIFKIKDFNYAPRGFARKK